MNNDCASCGEPNRALDIGEDNKCPYCGCVWQVRSNQGYCYKVIISKRADNIITDINDRFDILDL